MQDTPFELQRGELTLSTDRRRLDLDAVLALLAPEHWGGGLRRDVMERAIENSVCFGVYDGGRLVAFARAVTDRATYAYLTDVVVGEEHRGRGVGVWLVECILAHPDFQGLRRMALITRDAERLYERFGFGPASGSVYMELRDPGARRKEGGGDEGG
ncbi:MAG TPA: GNAT family N-acetyltransferase [Longimicrobium sp.]|jgi:N-acetylglutamate synthase-like GNAT family acetyltransferase